MRFIDLFCGIGGFRLGLEKSNGQQQENPEASGCGDSIGNKGEQSKQPQKWGNHTGGEPQPQDGGSEEGRNRTTDVGATQFHSGLNSPFTCVWSNDNDRYASQIYRKHWGEVTEGDIRAVDADAIPEHDLLCAGFPCQSFSIAGQRGGFTDTRGTLFFEIGRIAGAKGTPYLLLENVKGLLSAPYTKSIEEWIEADFDEFTGEPTAKALKKHKAIPGTKGWVFLTILNSLWELGYDAQWMVLNSKDFGVPQNRERVFIIGHLRGKSRLKVFPIGEELQEANQEECERGISGTLSVKNQSGQAQWDGSTTLIYEGAIMSEQNQKWLEDGKELSRNFPQGQRVYSTEGIASSICGDAGGLGGKTGLYAVLTPEREKKRQHGRRMKEDGEPMFTLTKQDVHGIADGVRIRRLTPLECERLQGFPDGWIEGISDTQRYKCLGNAVTVNVIEAIGRQFLESGGS